MSSWLQRLQDQLGQGEQPSERQSITMACRRRSTFELGTTSQLRSQALEPTSTSKAGVPKNEHQSAISPYVGGQTLMGGMGGGRGSPGRGSGVCCSMCGTYRGVGCQKVVLSTLLATLSAVGGGRFSSLLQRASCSGVVLRTSSSAPELDNQRTRGSSPGSRVAST